MSTYKHHFPFAKAYVSHLPLQETVESRSSEYWHILEVNASRITNDAKDFDYVEAQLHWLGVAALRALSIWLVIDPFKAKDDLVSALAERISNQLEMPSSQMILFLIEFLSHRRTDAIEEISRLLLPEEQHGLIEGAGIDDRSKKFCYASLVFFNDHRNLRLLMVFENAEQVGYSRYTLVPIAEIAGKPLEDEATQLVEERIQAGANLQHLEVDVVDSILKSFDKKHGGHRSRCFELFHDERSALTLLFILRHLREIPVREIDGVIFAEEAELIVLRYYNDGRRLDESSTTGIGPKIAAAIVGELLKESKVQYLEDTQLTNRKHLDKLLSTLTAGKGDRIRLRELYLKSAPLEEAPALILRCEKDRELSVPLKDARDQGINLLEYLSDVRHIGITYTAEVGANQYKDYIFKVFFKRTQSSGSSDYYLPYSVSNIPTRVRGEFEQHLNDNYDVRVIPGSG